MPLEAEVLNAERLTDNVAGLDGNGWRSDVVAIGLGRSSLTFELEDVVPLRGLIVQGASERGYVVLTSLDGRTWSELRRFAAPRAPGLATYRAEVGKRDALFLRIQSVTPEGGLAVAEVAAYCAPPDRWPALLRVEGKPDRDLLTPRKLYRYGIVSHKLTLGLFGLTAFIALILARSRRPAISPFALGLLIVFYGFGLIVTFAVVMNRALAIESSLQLGASLAAVASALLLSVLIRRGKDQGSASGRDAAGLIFALNGGLAALYAAVVTWLHAPHAFADPLSLGLYALAPIVILACHKFFRQKGRWLSVAVPSSCLVLAGFMAMTNFGGYFQWRAVVAGWEAEAERLSINEWHGVLFHDQFHYYMGSKYAAEISYDMLYHCAAVAELENGRGDVVARRPVRDLSTNELQPGSAFLDQTDACRERFTTERWMAFRADIAYFFTRVNPEVATRYLTDHGYNATPFWTGINGFLSSATSASDTTQSGLAALDIVLALAMAALLGWAFGIETSALAIFVWGVGVVWVYTHVGAFGSFGRFWWLFAVVAGICLIKKRWYLLGGAALALATLFRVFPLFLYFGACVRSMFDVVRRRRIDRRIARQAFGAVIGAILGVTVSAVALPGFEAYHAFVGNAHKHTATPLSNYMGLKTIIAWKAETKLLRTFDRDAVEPAHKWRALRKRAFEDRRWFHVFATILLMGLAASAAVRAQPPWHLAILGLLPMFALLELTNYYYAILIILAPLALRRPADLLAFFALGLGSQIIFLVSFFERSDVTYTVDSLLVLCGLVYFVCSASRRHRGKDSVQDATAPELALATEKTAAADWR